MVPIHDKFKGKGAWGNYAPCPYQFQDVIFFRFDTLIMKALENVSEEYIYIMLYMGPMS